MRLKSLAREHVTRTGTMLTTLWSLFVVAFLMAFADAGAGESSSLQSIYRVGPNDVVRIQVFGEEELTVERKVDGDGKIDYPLLGTLVVGGKTAEEFQQHLTARLAEGYLRHPKVSVSIVRHRNFYVGGEVKTPGGFPYESGMTVQKAIAIAGGFTERSDKLGVQLKRSNAQTAEGTTVSPDASVFPDDLIYVPQAKRIYVNGEVKMPGSFSYEKGLTVHKAITIAGGFTDKAAKTSTKVIRIIEGKEHTIEVSLETLVLPEDIIVVPQRFF